MARGWESKSVEDQIQARESQESPRQKITPEENQRRAKREAMLMARTRTLSKLQSVCDARHRGHLERVLADLDAQLAELGFSDGK